MTDPVTLPKTTVSRAEILLLLLADELDDTNTHPDLAKRAREVQEELRAHLSAPGRGEASSNLAMWLSAALDDPAVCAEMKRDITAWFDAGQPSHDHDER
jgi:hypothetical protein